MMEALDESQQVSQHGASKPPSFSIARVKIQGDSTP